MGRTVRIGRYAIPLWVLILAAVLVSAAAATTIIAQYRITYEITPPASPPTQSPSTVSLNLGSIPSGSAGTKEFEKFATLNLPVGYTITCMLTPTPAEDFDDFKVNIYFFRAGITEPAKGWIYLTATPGLNEDSTTLDAGKYDVTVKVTYTAKALTTTKTGEVKITVSY